MTARDRLAAALDDGEDAAYCIAADPNLEADLETGAALRELEAALGEHISTFALYFDAGRVEWMAIGGDIARSGHGPTIAAAARALIEKLP